jgi:electron transfer flavoprotein alpha subunit
MTTLLVAEHDGRKLNPVTAKVLTAALRLGEPVDVLVAGAETGAVAAEAATLGGVARVLEADAQSLAHGLAEPLSRLIAGLAGEYGAIVSAASSTGKNVMPRVAAMLDVMQVSDLVEVVASDTFRRPTYAGNAIQTVRSRDRIKVLTVRSSAFTATPPGPPVTIEAVPVSDEAGRSVWVDQSVSASDLPELSSARIVISGGRALGSREKFMEALQPVAERLGAAIGASRAAVDAGYAPNDWQVGQTGKIVAPDLYVACGISGAIQHLAGMKESRVIVAINQDGDAPIFEVADYGLVGDLFRILPELVAELDRRAGKSG